MDIKVYLSRLPKFKIIVYSIIIVIIGTLLFSPYGIIRTISLHQEFNDVVEELNSIKITNDSLRSKIKDLKYDSLEIEKIAREQYGMVREGEKVYIKKGSE